MTFVIEKMKLASCNLFLDAFPPRPKMPFGQLNVAIQIYNICKGRLGSRGGGGGGRERISERRHQISCKINHLARWSFLLCINCINSFTVHSVVPS